MEEANSSESDVEEAHEEEGEEEDSDDGDEGTGSSDDSSEEDGDGSGDESQNENVPDENDTRDFESSPSSTPSELKHEDDFKDLDAEDENYVPSHSDEDEPHTDGQLSQAEEEEPMEESVAGSAKIPVDEDDFIIEDEAFESSDNQSDGTDFDGAIKTSNLPTHQTSNEVTYTLQEHMAPCGIPILAATIHDEIYGWLSLDDTAYRLLHKLFLSGHEIQLRLQWKYQQRVPRGGIRFVGTASWRAVCEDGIGIESYYRPRVFMVDHFLHYNPTRHDPAADTGIAGYERKSPVFRALREDDLQLEMERNKNG
ncbi:hypothetical protein BJ508DRAFT_336708 [Ascobolus immersus RN42]|uniref:Uncharacterized protein n=1 Tax=Ascobolus immersus RN42 TaxID=1160509 RepID=A0A3N4HCK6_ASCIM|nr:hypothetical protein BJ508DRAFT_336708 [Ascobolus immersus RN42]